MYITRENNDCGLGDAMSQIDFFYKLAQKQNVTYVHTPITSKMHEEDYDFYLGLNNYELTPNFLSLNVVSLDLQNFLSNNYSIENLIYSIPYDYEFCSKMYYEELIKLENFPFTKYFDYSSIKQSEDVLLHIRLGDSHIYPLSRGYFFDARLKAIITKPTRITWTFDNLKVFLNHFHDKKIRVITDGVDKVNKIIKLIKNDNYFSPEIIEKYIYEFHENLINILDRSNVKLEMLNMRETINIALSSKDIICTDGSLMYSINRLLRQPPTIIRHLNSFF